MKTVNVVIPAVIVRALDSRYDVKKLQSALDADYNNDKDTDKDKESALAVNTVDAGIKTARAKEGKADGAKGEFRATDVHKIERSGVLNDPRRMIAWLVAFAKFIKTNGEPSGELTPDVLPANLVFWLERKFVKADIAEKEKAKDSAKNGTGHRNRNAGNVKNGTGHRNAGNVKNGTGHRNAGNVKNGTGHRNAGNVKNGTGHRNAGNVKNVPAPEPAKA